MGRHIVIVATAWLLIAFCSERRPAPGGKAAAGAASTEAAASSPGGKASDDSTKKDETMNAMKRIDNAFAPQVAGQFYPDDPKELRQDVEGFIAAAKSKKIDDLAKRDIVGIIAPHAGYPFSGPIAGESYRAVKGRDYHTVVVMALSHRRDAPKLEVLKRPAYDTPLGSVPIDEAGVASLIGEFPEIFGSDESAFRGEHSLEVQLPFIQVALPNAKIVPIIVAVYDNEALIPQAAKALFDIFGSRKDVLFVGSTDLTHYMPYDDAVKYDREVLGLLEKWNIEEWKSVAPTKKGMCGHLPVRTLVELFSKYNEKERRVDLIDYRNSGDTYGDKARGVVGYGAMAFSVSSSTRTEEGRDFGPLTAADRQYLMNVAKESVRAAVTGERYEPEPPKSGILSDKGAAFVTLKEDGDLRGCIGHVIARIPLYQCVNDVARAAAINDTRFSPVRKDEIPKLTFEISVLTPPEPTTPDQVVVGRDGLIMSRGYNSGLLLPQVPIEWGWDKEQFLAHTCMKAGLPSDCWKDPKTEIQSFRAIVFGEKDLK